MGILNRVKWSIIGVLISILILIVGASLMPDKFTEAINWVANTNLAPEVKTFTESRKIPAANEMKVVGIRMSQISYEPVVILKEKQGERYLPIWIGLMEANAIGVVLEGINTPRPLSHDLLYSILQTVGAEVNFITISDIQNGTYYAKIVLSIGGRQLEIDSRPSDAIAIALRARASIYAEEKVLDKAGIKTDQSTSSITL